MTSDVEITNVQCIGFALCVNSKPAGDGNGDFVKVDKLDCQYSTYCISIGNTQARSTSIKNITANRVYAVLTNNRFGLGLGVLDGPIENISLGESYQFFNLGALSYFGNTTVRNIYGEAFVRVGSFSNGASFTSSLTLDGCDLSLYQQLTQVIPAALIEAASTGGAIPITFRSCMLANGGQRIDTLIHGSAAVVIDGGAFKGGASLGSVFGTSPVQQALNYTGSVLVGSAMTFPLSPGYSPFSPLKWLNPTVAAFMTNPNSSDGQQYMGTDASFMFGRRARGQFTQATTSFVDLFNNRRWQFALGPTGSLIQLSNTTAGDVTVVATYTGCDSMRFTYAARQQSPQNQSSNIATGDILYHENTGTIFVITTIDAPDRRGNYPITARQMNNMNINPNKYACASNNISDPTVGGHTFLIHTGVMNVPAMPFFGSFTLGSTNVTNVSRGDGYAGDLSAYVNSGDKILGYPKGQDSYFGWPYPAGASIAAVIDGSPGGLTLSAPATLSGRFPILPLPVVGGPQ